MSVDAEPLLIHAGLDWAFSLRDFPDHSLSRLRAGVARGLGQSVVHDPLPDNHAHAEVRGKKTQGLANQLLRATESVVLRPKASSS